MKQIAQIQIQIFNTKKHVTAMDRKKKDKKEKKEKVSKEKKEKSKKGDKNSQFTPTSASVNFRSVKLKQIISK